MLNNIQNNLQETKYFCPVTIKILKIKPNLDNNIEQNTTQIQNTTQSQQSNDILELKNMIKGLLGKMDSMLNIKTALVSQKYWCKKNI